MTTRSRGHHIVRLALAAGSLMLSACWDPNEGSGGGAGGSGSWFYTCAQRNHNGRLGTWTQYYESQGAAQQAGAQHTQQYGADHTTTVYQGG